MLEKKNILVTCRAIALQCTVHIKLLLDECLVVYPRLLGADLSVLFRQGGLNFGHMAIRLFVVMRCSTFLRIGVGPIITNLTFDDIALELVLVLIITAILL